ncbi:putative carboxylesterase 7 [Glycine soja]
MLEFEFEFVFVTVRVAVPIRVCVRHCRDLVTLDLSCTVPLWVCVYSDPGAHLSMKFPSKVRYVGSLKLVSENDLLKDMGWYYNELLKKCGWNGVVKVIEAKGEGGVFHLLNPDCDNVVSLLD